jgi:glycogen debranching enzyme
MSPQSPETTVGVSYTDPANTRSSRKREVAALALRDVNRCSARPTDLITHRGYAVLVTDTQGWIGGEKEGFFLHQTRYLSHFSMKIEGADPKFISANTVDHHFLTAYHFAPSPAGRAGGPTPEDDGSTGGEVVQKGIELHINTLVGDGLHLDIIVTNHSLAPTTVSVSLDVMADFADLNEAQAGERQQNALVERIWRASASAKDEDARGELAFRYAHPDLQLATRLRIAGSDAIIDTGGALACALSLRPHEPRIITVDLIPVFEGKPIEPFFGRDGTFDHDARATKGRHRWLEGCAIMTADNPVVQTAWDQAVSDLASLQLLDGPGDEPYMIIAGVPNYTGLFGRDAYVTSLQTAGLTPATLRGSLQAVSRWNATATDDYLDAEPGKVLHQRQRGPLAQLGLSPFLHYYGDHSTPGLFLIAAAADLAHTGDLDAFRSLKDKLLGTLAWMERNADEDGFDPYQTRSKQGLKNQSWKDSGDAVLYPDGRMVKDPIAMSDVQGLVYAGKQAIALAFAVEGDHDRSAKLLFEAAALKQRFNARFWMPEENYFAIALDPDGKQVRSVASDPGSCLAYGIVEDERAAAVADRLLADDMFSGWGIRTLSSRHPAYNPFAYHLGTVWPSPNSIAAFGLMRYGFVDHMHKVAAGLFATTQVLDLDRLPEVFGGHTRDARHPHPGLYPGACSPQAWSAGAVILLVMTMIGLTPLAPRGTLVVDPVLPDWLPEVTIRNIQVGAARASLRLRRDSTGHTDVEVMDGGGLYVVRPAAAIKPGVDRVPVALTAALRSAQAVRLSGQAPVT